MPLVAAVVGTGGTVAAVRPAHAAQVVMPSAICAPHELQNAIRNLLRIAGSRALGGESASARAQAASGQNTKKNQRKQRSKTLPTHATAAYFSAKSPR